MTREDILKEMERIKQLNEEIQAESSEEGMVYDPDKWEERQEAARKYEPEFPFFSADDLRTMLQIEFGESLGDIVASEEYTDHYVFLKMMMGLNVVEWSEKEYQERQTQISRALAFPEK